MGTFVHRGTRFSKSLLYYHKGSRIQCKAPLGEDQQVSLLRLGLKSSFSSKYFREDRKMAER